MEESFRPKDLKAKMMAMMILRVVIALVFLGITTWFQVKEYPSAQLNLYPLYAVVVVLGLLTILYALALKWVKNLGPFIYTQIAVDLLLITFIVYTTGAIESYLQILYFLSIIGATIMLGRSCGYYAASLSSIAYGVVIDADFYGMLPARFKVFMPGSLHVWEDALTTVSTNILAFFSVAYLAGYLAEKTKRYEKRLEAKEIDYEKLESLNRHIVENITSGIMTLDEHSRITSYNHAAVSITGFTLQDVYYKGVDEVFPGLLADVRGVAGIRLEKKVRKKGGGEMFLGLMVSHGRGGAASRIIIFQDLTELKAMEEQIDRAEKLKALGELSVGIAHEIRNPLASISGSIQLLKEQLALNDEDRTLMGIVLRETERLNALVTDFLVFARPARNERGTVNLSGVINETIQMFRNSPEAAGIEIESSLNNDIYVEGDGRQIGQVFWNIFLNSAQAMDHDGRLIVTSSFRTGYDGVKGTLLTRSASACKDYSFVGVKVVDTGRGIESDKIKKIFDPFYSTKPNGTGLGLAIAHRIVQSHGGTIEVRSRLGRGTVFKVILPAAAGMVH
ncbi:MAG TPA: ATP-binding protein [Thermodesulfobacteriota bacterium]|nr:ATP-binding protein [Thermodesulfobacteriota bacterium]